MQKLVRKLNEVSRLKLIFIEHEYYINNTCFRTRTLLRTQLQQSFFNPIRLSGMAMMILKKLETAIFAQS